MLNESQDPDAVKPDAWDESAPETIPDPSAERPEVMRPVAPVVAHAALIGLGR